MENNSAVVKTSIFLPFLLDNCKIPYNVKEDSLAVAVATKLQFGSIVIHQ
jgi:hypothetical protein